MIKTISYWSLDNGLEGTGPIDAALQQAKSHNFPAVELAIAEQGVLTPQTDEKTCTEYRKLAEKHGIAVHTLASGITWGCCPSHPDPAVRKKSVELQSAALQRAAWLGCQSMLFIPGAVKIPWDNTYAPVRYDKAAQWAKEAVRQMAPIAEKTGVELCIENVWNGLFPSPLELAAFVDSFHSEKVGIYFDVGNLLNYHQHPPHWIEILGQRIKRVHFKDFKTSVGTMAGFCDLLEGDVPWPQTMQALKSIGYNKTVVAEMIPSSNAILAKTSQTMDKILAF
jgi:hexulose-6-phosphate isomerase